MSIAWPDTAQRSPARAIQAGLAGVSQLGLFVGGKVFGHAAPPDYLCWGRSTALLAWEPSNANYPRVLLGCHNNINAIM